jgi:hypothetical protein
MATKTPKAPKATASNVKDFSNEVAIQQAVTIRSLAEFIDKGTQSMSATKKTLTDAIRTDCISSMVEDDKVYGNYQIPIRYLDEEGKVVDEGNIVEVVLSCETDELSDAEINDLTNNLGVPNFDKLFIKTEIVTKVTDPSALLTTMASTPNKASIFELSKSGDLSFGLPIYKGMPGVDTRTVTKPRSGFFISLQEVFDALQGKDVEAKALATWMEGRTKFAVKTGNRAKETT